MPYSNIIPAPPASLTSIAIYLANDSHKHHQDYELTPIQVLGATSVQDFIAYARKTFLMNKRKGTGRPPKNAAKWIIVRTPDGSHLELHEMAAYENTARDVASHGGPVVGILNWHKNKYTGAADMNLLSAAFSAEGAQTRDRNINPVKNLRLRMDQVTDALNVQRLSRGIPPIVTMQEIKKERAQQRGEMDVVEELAKMPKPPATTADLKPALIKLECTISRFNPAKNSISVTPKGKKKAKRFAISKLLADVAEKMGLIHIKPSPKVKVPSKPATGKPSKPTTWKSSPSEIGHP